MINATLCLPEMFRDLGCNTKGFECFIQSENSKKSMFFCVPCCNIAGEKPMHIQASSRRLLTDIHDSMS